MSEIGRARQAYVVGKRRLIRADKRRLDRELIALRLGRLRIKARLLSVKTRLLLLRAIDAAIGDARP